MLAHGDELGRTQRGNNNGYCQDNEITWVDWDLDEAQQSLHEFTRRVVHLRRDHPVFRQRRFFAGAAEHGGESDLRDIAWMSPSGAHMSDEAWGSDHAFAVMVFLNGDAIDEPDERGEEVVDDSFLLLFNSHWEKKQFQLPGAEYGAVWTAVLDTDGQVKPGREVRSRGRVTLAPRSTVLFTRPPERELPGASGSGAAANASREATRIAKGQV
jgi:glycogen operon protein